MHGSFLLDKLLFLLLNFSFSIINFFHFIPFIQQDQIRIYHSLSTGKLYADHKVTEEFGLTKEKVRYQSHIIFRLMHHLFHIHHHGEIIIRRKAACTFFIHRSTHPVHLHSPLHLYKRKDFVHQVPATMPPYKNRHTCEVQIP